MQLGQNDEQGEQFENEEFRKKYVLVLMRRVSSYKLEQDEKILSLFLVKNDEQGEQF